MKDENQKIDNNDLSSLEINKLIYYINLYKNNPRLLSGRSCYKVPLQLSKIAEQADLNPDKKIAIVCRNTRTVERYKKISKKLGFDRSNIIITDKLE